MKTSQIVLFGASLLIFPASSQIAPYSPFCSKMDSIYNDTPYFCGPLGPFSPINVTRFWTVNCNYQGMVTATQSASLSGTGTCGVHADIASTPDCVPKFEEIIGLSADANYHTWRGRVTNLIIHRYQLCSERRQPHSLRPYVQHHLLPKLFSVQSSRQWDQWRKL